MHQRAVLQSALLAATILLLATACTQNASDAASTAATPAAAAPTATTDTSAPAPASSTAAPASAAATATTANTDSTPASSTPASAAPAGATPVEGTDYTLINTPDQPSGDKVEVTEVFGYGCPHCAAFQPYISAWAKKLPAGVQLTYLPAAFGSDPEHCWDDFARAYYASQAMGIVAKSHDGVYKEVFEKHRFNGCASIPSLYADFGVDPKTFASTMQSFAVNAKIAAARDQAMRWGVDATPTVVVDGKYRVQELRSTGPEGVLRTVDWLIAKQRPAHAKH